MTKRSIEPEVTKCVSPTETGVRCKCESIGNSLFCKEHIIYKRDYIKYKRLESYLPSLLKKWPPKKKIAVKRLLRVYNTLEKCYTLRVEYRKKAFVKEAWDYGHDLRISILWEYIEDYLNVLEEKFKEMSNIREEDVFTPRKDEEKDLTLNVRSKNKANKIRRIRKKMMSIEEEFNTEIPKAIKLKKEQEEVLESTLNKYDKLLVEKLSTLFVLGEIKPGLLRFYIIVYRYHELLRTAKRFDLSSVIYIKETLLDLKVYPFEGLYRIKIEDFILKIYTHLGRMYIDDLYDLYRVHSSLYNKLGKSITNLTKISIKRLPGVIKHEGLVFRLYNYAFLEVKSAYITFQTLTTPKGIRISNNDIKNMTSGPNPRFNGFISPKGFDSIMYTKQAQAISLLKENESLFYKENLLGNLHIFTLDLIKHQTNTILRVRKKGSDLDYFWDQIVDKLKQRK